jgi:hypothetical protein
MRKGVIGSFIMKGGVIGSFIGSFIVKGGVIGSFIMRGGFIKFFIIKNGIIGSFIMRKAGPEHRFPEEDTFCSEALHENASILRKVWNILFGRTKEKKSMHHT